MGLDPSSRRQDRRLWQLLPPTYPTDSLHSSCYQCWCTTPSRLPTTAAAAHPNKTAPFLWACGTDERLPRHFQSPTYVDPRAAQGLETPSRTSTSHLASDPKRRPPSAQPRTQLSMATCPGQRSENVGGNSWKQLRSSLGLTRDDDDDSTFECLHIDIYCFLLEQKCLLYIRCLDWMLFVRFGHQDKITNIDVLSQERVVTSGARDGSVRIWKIVEESQLVFHGHRLITCCCFFTTRQHSLLC